MYGGSEMTITGVFPASGNELFITIGNTQCEILSQSSTEITCRVAADFNRELGIPEISIMNEYLEEATCNMDNGCSVELVAEEALPTVTGMEPRFNTETGLFELVISGSGFEGALTNGDIESMIPTVGGEEATVFSVSDEEIIIQID